MSANKIIGNDICEEVIEVYKGIQKEGVNNSLNLIKEQIKKYNLNKENEEGFKDIRNHYNTTDKSWYIFYSMLVHAFNYQIRFNKKGEYNMPFGKNRSSFNPTLEKNFIKFANTFITKISRKVKWIKLERIMSFLLVQSTVLEAISWIHMRSI